MLKLTFLSVMTAALMPLSASASILIQYGNPNNLKLTSIVNSAIVLNMKNIRGFQYQASGAGSSFCIETIDSSEDSRLITAVKAAASLDEGAFSQIDQIESCK